MGNYVAYAFCFEVLGLPWLQKSHAISGNLLVVSLKTWNADPQMQAW